MSDQDPYIRKITLYVFPNDETKGLIPDGQAMKIYSDGSRMTLGMSFQTNSNMWGFPPATTIRIYNLSQDTRNGLAKARAKVSLRAQWGNMPEWEIFNGGIASVVTRREGADFVTTLSCLTAIACYVSTPTVESYSGGVEISWIVSQVAKKLQGVTVDPKKIKLPTSVRLPKGGSAFSGNAVDYLNKLARQYGFCWWVANGVFYAVRDGDAFDNTINVSYWNGTLLASFPLLDGPMQFQRGVKIKSVLIPGFGTGDKVNLTSASNEYLNGTYVIQEMSATGSTINNDWFMELTGRTFNPDTFYPMQRTF